ncbi:hypothetical protein ACFL6S_26725 [Candidatus Poribacteria bacterium]
MIEWILDNKEWVFSGFGIAVLSGGLALVMRLLRRRKNKENLIAESVHDSAVIQSGGDMKGVTININPVSQDETGKTNAKPVKPSNRSESLQAGAVFIAEESDSDSLSEQDGESGDTLHIIGIEDESKFYRTVVSPTDNNDRDTLLCFRVKVLNNGLQYANMDRYEVSIPSLEYKGEPRLVLEKEKVRYRTGGASSVWLGMDSLANDEGLVYIEPNGKMKIGNLYFRIPIVLPKETKELYCKLRVWDYNNHGASCEVKLTKEGY